jgi:hypothetical protein
MYKCHYLSNGKDVVGEGNMKMKRVTVRGNAANK